MTSRALTVQDATLPADRPSFEAGHASLYTKAAVARRRSKLVICVDDDPNLRSIVHTSLSDAGYTVLACRDGETVLSMLSRYQPRILLLDIEMPELDGYQTLGEIRRRFPALRSRIVFLTGRRTLRDVAEARRLGCDDYMIKPFTTAALIQRLDHWITTQTPSG
jgi:DNA-binding response OmpR family regulator